MSVIDVACFLILVLSILNGVMRGALRLIWSIICLAIAYVAAYALANRVGAVLHERLVDWEFFATILGGLIVFWAVLLLLELFAFVVKRLSAVRRDGSPTRGLSGLNRVCGGVIGSILGLLFVVVLCWSYQLILGTDWGAALPTGHRSISIRFSESVIRHGSQIVLERTLDEPETAERVARLISAPQKTTVALKEVASSPSIQQLAQSASFQEDLLSGEKERILANDEFIRVVEDQDLLAHLARAGILEELEIGSESREEIADELAKVGDRVSELLDDPLAQTDIDGLRADGLLELDRVFELMLDGRFQRLLNRVTRRQ